MRPSRISFLLAFVGVVIFCSCTKEGTVSGTSKTATPQGNIVAGGNSADYTGDYLRTALLSDGRLVVAYFNESKGALEIMVEKTANSRQFNLPSLVRVQGHIIGKHNDLYIAADDTIHLSTIDRTDGSVVYVSGSERGFSEPETVDTELFSKVGLKGEQIFGKLTSITGDNNGNVYLTYYKDGQLMLADKSQGDDEWQLSKVKVPKEQSHAELEQTEFGRFHVTRLANNKTLYTACYNSSQGDLWLFTGKASGEGMVWQMEIVDSDGDVGTWLDMTVDSNNNPVISYYDATNGSLKVARPRQAQVLVADDSGNVGLDSSIRIGKDNRAYITHLNADAFDVMYTWESSDKEFSTRTLTKDDGVGGFFTSQERLGDGVDDFVVFYHHVSGQGSSQKVFSYPPS